MEYTDSSRCRARELPNQLPPAALSKLIKRSTSEWEDLAVDLIAQVKPLLLELLEELIKEMFGQYEYGRLPTTIRYVHSHP